MRPSALASHAPLPMGGRRPHAPPRPSPPPTGADRGQNLRVAHPPAARPGGTAALAARSGPRLLVQTSSSPQRPGEERTRGAPGSGRTLAAPAREAGDPGAATATGVGRVGGRRGAAPRPARGRFAVPAAWRQRAGIFAGRVTELEPSSPTPVPPPPRRQPS